MICRSEKETIELGARLGGMLSAGSFVVLRGDLASGKTTFTKGIGKALNISEVINSPTFTILKIYKGSEMLYHVDAYRLEHSDYDLGIAEYEDEGIIVLEWPEYYEAYLPAEYLEVIFTYVDENTRDIEFRAHGDKYRQIEEEMKC